MRLGSATETQGFLIRFSICVAPEDRLSNGLIHLAADVWLLPVTSIALDERGVFEVPLGDENDLIMKTVSCLRILP